MLLDVYVPGLQVFPPQVHRSSPQVSQSHASTAAVQGGDAVAPGTWDKKNKQLHLLIYISTKALVIIIPNNEYLCKAL